MSKTNVNIDFSKPNDSILDGVTLEKETVVVKTGKRHVIAINDITLERNIYKTESLITTNNLIKKPAKSIAIFANEYIPQHFPKGEYIYYTLTVNGIDYKITPINIDRNGTKIIKTSDFDIFSNYSIYIGEEIKTAYLTIKMRSISKYETPFLKNIKVLLGDRDV